MALVEHVIVDSGGFIRNAPLRNIGENIYTIHQVVDEIRDKTTRERLQVLPYKLNFKEPSSDAIRIVTEFSKKTGDYRNLSAVDIRVLALVYHLEKESCGSDHINVEPQRNITWQTTRKNLENPTEIAGFYLGKKNTTKTKSDSDGTHNIEDHIKEININAENNCEQNDSGEECDPKDAKLTATSTVTDTTSKEDRPERSVEIRVEGGDTEKKVQFVGEGDVLDGELESDEESDSDEEESDDSDGWITPSNVKQMKEKMGDVNTEVARVKVGCVTTDFAMQNVLIQMGLNVISVDGMLIKRAKNYVYRCYACFKVSTDMTRMFCHHCGNQTLQRVSMTVEEDGSIKYFLSSKKPITAKGKRYSLPLPKGGKHANNPILCEDQREAQQRPSKASRVNYDVFDPNYTAFSSPFAPTDTHSRAAQLGIKGHRNKRQHNEFSKRQGRRK